jgi:hypothetical protein
MFYQHCPAQLWFTSTLNGLDITNCMSVKQLARTADWWRYASHQGIRESGDVKGVLQGTQLGVP